MPTENKLAPSLPEVKRCQLKGFIPGVKGESKAVFRPVVVLADDFDRIAAERDALQLRLNAADQRIDELVELLRDAGGAVNGHAMTAWAIPLSKKIAAALNHTESRAGERCHEIPGTSGMRLNMLANQGE